MQEVAKGQIKDNVLKVTRWCKIYNVKTPNRYISITRSYLKKYNQFKITIENLTDEITAQEELLNSDVAASISKYGDDTIGGTSELNTVESAVYRHEIIEKRISEMRANVTDIERIIRKVNRAIEGLSKENKQLITAYYIDGKNWQEIGKDNYFTEKWARDKGNKAIKELSKMIFGF